MQTRTWTSLLLIATLVNLAAFVGCHDSNDPPFIPDPTEDVRDVLQALSFLLPAISPFNPAPPPPALGVQPACSPYDVTIPGLGTQVCPDHILECPPGTDGSIDILFEDCAVNVVIPTIGNINVVINGVLNYVEGETYPTGTRTVDFINSFYIYDMTFTNDPVDGDVAIRVTVKINDAMYDCVGNLDAPEEATCEPVPEPEPLGP